MKSESSSTSNSEKIQSLPTWSRLRYRTVLCREIITTEEFVDFREDPDGRIMRWGDFAAHMAKSTAFISAKKQLIEKCCVCVCTVCTVEPSRRQEDVSGFVVE